MVKYKRDTNDAKNVLSLFPSAKEFEMTEKQQITQECNIKHRKKKLRLIMRLVTNAENIDQNQ